MFILVPIMRFKTLFSKSDRQRLEEPDARGGPGCQSAVRSIMVPTCQVTGVQLG